ncbi:MAG: glycosyltransferase family 2 protein [Gemmatimonadaceae bacterium]|nr:glycosyltransferase family 2 protein [Gemmatimonadaceae bacterium]
MQMVNPLVSVLMTAYNREQYVGEAIESVLSSTYRDFELIVADDCSTDSTVDIVRQYARSDDRITLIVSETNLGDYPNRNRVASHAKGEYLKYVDSDDVIYPHGLEVMIRCMNTFPAAGLGLSALPDLASPCPLSLTPREAYSEHFFQRDLLGRAPGSAIIRRSAFEQSGGFSGRRQVGDHELWLKIARVFDVVKIPTALVWDRSHPDQEKHFDNAAAKLVMHEEVLLAALSAPDCPLTVKERDAAAARLSRNRAGNYWRLLMSGGERAVAGKYRRAAGVPAASIGGFALGRILRVASPFSPPNPRS